MVVCKIELHLEYIHIAYTFLHVWHQFVAQIIQKFLQWSSVRSLLRVCCWLETPKRISYFCIKNN